MRMMNIAPIGGEFPEPKPYSRFEITILECLTAFAESSSRPVSCDLRFVPGFNPGIRSLFPKVTFVDWPADRQQSIDLVGDEVKDIDYFVCVPFLDPSLFLHILGNIWKIIAISPFIKRYGLCLHLSPPPKAIVIAPPPRDMIRIPLPAGKIYRPEASNNQVIYCTGDDIWANEDDVGVSYQALFVNV